MTQLSFFFLWYPSDFIRWTKSWKFLNQGWRKRRKNKWRDEKLFYSLFINCWKKGKWKERFLSIAGVKEPFYYVRRTRSCIYDSSPFCIYNSSPFFLTFGMAKGRMSMHAFNFSLLRLRVTTACLFLYFLLTLFKNNLKELVINFRSWLILSINVWFTCHVFVFSLWTQVLQLLALQ